MDLVHARHRGEVADGRESGGRFDEQHDLHPAGDHADEPGRVGRGFDHRQHHDAGAQTGDRVDLRGGTVVQGIDADEEVGVAQRRADAREIRGRVRRHPRAQPALALGLAEALEVDADPVDAGRVGPRRQRRVARPEGQDERVRRRSGTGSRACRAGGATRPDSRSHTDG